MIRRIFLIMRARADMIDLIEFQASVILTQSHRIRQLEAECQALERLL